MQSSSINCNTGPDTGQKPNDLKKNVCLDALKKPINFLSENPKTVIAVASLVALAAGAYYYSPALMQSFNMSLENRTLSKASPVKTIVKELLQIPTTGVSQRADLLGSELLPTCVLPQTPRNIVVDLAHKMGKDYVGIYSKYLPDWPITVLGRGAIPESKFIDLLRNGITSMNRYLLESDIMTPGFAHEKVQEIYDREIYDSLVMKLTYESLSTLKAVFKADHQARYMGLKFNDLVPQFHTYAIKYLASLGIV